MSVGQIVRQAIQYMRVMECVHVWVRLNDTDQWGDETEDQCLKCGIIATAEGKKNLERMSRLTPVKT